MQGTRQQQLWCGVKGCKKLHTFSHCEVHSLHASLGAAQAELEEVKGTTVP
jgi:hypothetical protein